MSDLVYYQLGDRGCASLLVSFFNKGYSFSECFGCLYSLFPCMLVCIVMADSDASTVQLSSCRDFCEFLRKLMRRETFHFGYKLLILTTS